MDRETLQQKYFTDTLSAEEQQLLERHLQEDPAFAEHFEFEKDLNKALIKEGGDSLREHLRTKESSFATGKPLLEEGLGIRRFMRYAIAACVIIGVTLLATEWFMPNPSNADLFAQNFEPYRNVVQPIERDAGPQDAQGLAFLKYEQEHYKEAATSFRNIYETTGAEYLLFYEANALLHEGETDAAITLLLKHQQFEDSFYGKSRWYLGLAYLQKDRVKDARRIFESIVADDSYKAQEAARILSKMD